MSDVFLKKLIDFRDFCVKRHLHLLFCHSLFLTEPIECPNIFGCLYILQLYVIIVKSTYSCSNKELYAINCRALFKYNKGTKILTNILKFLSR